MFLVNKISKTKVLVFPSTFDAIKANLPEMFEVAKNLEPQGEDLNICQRDISRYNDNKLIVCVRRLRGEIDVIAQLMYDWQKNGELWYHNELSLGFLIKAKLKMTGLCYLNDYLFLLPFPRCLCLYQIMG